MVQEMVKTGQSAATARIGFSNSSMPGFGIEVLTLLDVVRRVSAAHLSSPRRTTFYQLTLVTSGTLVHEVDFVRYELKAGMLAFVRPDQVQRLTVNRRSEAQMVLLEPSFLHPDLYGLKLRAMATILRPGSGTREAFQVLDREHLVCRDHPGRTSESILLHLLMVLLFQMQRESETSMPASTSNSREQFDSFEELLEKIFASERSVSAYARRIGCSEKTLDRACLSVAGLTPKQMIQRRVVLEAKRILAYSGLPVKSLAHALGFSEVTNFVKYFRRATTESPAAFRSRVQESSTRSSNEARPSP